MDQGFDAPGDDLERYAPRVDFLPRAVLDTPGRLGITRAPGRWSPGRSPDGDLRLRRDLHALARDHGARLLVTLLERPEIDELGSLARESRRAGLSWLHFPIPDMWFPSNMGKARKLVRRIVVALEHGDDVIVHCWGGLGRAGTIAATTLVARGLAPEPAIAAVRAAREGAVQTSEQEQFVAKFADALVGER
jgi:ADP-ribosyl-[dinitrogen reductase] hydrolase